MSVVIEPGKVSAGTRRTEFWQGVVATAPLLVGAAPFGLLFGALAVANGITPLGAIALSAIVFAGAAQFIAVGLVANGAGLLVIVLTTLVVNLRHVLYGAALAPHLKRLPQRWLLSLAFWLTDETFAVVSTRYQATPAKPYKHWFQLGSAVAMYINWQVWTIIGVRAGALVREPGAWGLDFAFVATFIGILAPGLRTRPQLVCAITAGVSAFILRGLPNQLGLICAAGVGVGAGLLASLLGGEHRWRKEVAEHDLL